MRALEIKVGALILASMAVLAGFIAILGGFSFRSGYRLYVDFDFSGNIHTGAAVKLSGIRVGKVQQVRFMGGAFDDKVKRRVQVRLVLEVEERAREAIHEDARFYVNTQGVLGEQYLEIEPGSPDRPPLAPGSIVRGVDPPRTDLILARLYDFLDSITSLLERDRDVIRDLLRSGARVARTLDDVLNENRGEIKKLLVDLDRLTAAGAELLAKIDRGVGDAEQLKRTLSNIESISASIRGQIDPLIQKTRRALDGVGDVTAVVGPEERKKLVKALDDLVATSAKVQALSNDAALIIADIRKGRGTAGALLVDQQIYDDLKELVRDLKRNPWKFFWKE
ncbi:MAG: MlaD family protein [Myxococcales bacterium]|nr:MlaD family protein [Myxococcota bacterium]MDW8280068.1 MlaD family protein [Myxococcales bacterium]